MIRIPQTLALVGLATAVACGDAVAPEDIAGTWSATSFVFTRVADTGDTIDIIGAGGSVSITFNANGTYSITFDVDGAPDTSTGSYAIDGSTITLDEGTVDEVSGTIDLSGNTLTLRITSGLEFEFNDSGMDEPATLIAVFTRD
jgi:Lipocalin-like domain